MYIVPVRACLSYAHITHISPFSAFSLLSRSCRTRTHHARIVHMYARARAQVPNVPIISLSLSLSFSSQLSLSSSVCGREGGWRARVFLAFFLHASL